MNWLYYLLEANLYLVLFYGFYRLFLQNETFYNLNRYFLLLSTLISFALPVLQLGFLKPTIDQIHSDYLYVAGEVPPMPIEPPSSFTSSAPVNDINWFYIVYLVIAFGFALKLSFSIYKIIKLWFKAEKQTAGKITLIKVNDESTAFSFFNLLFIHPELANQPAVLKHEMVHIKQKHSFDVVFFEIVQIVCWFNPILYFIKKDMKLLHEYIADELTTNVDIQKHEYALFLIQNSFGLRAQPITNQIFNQSILKRRINMLNKKRTATWARLRLLLAFPLTGGMLCISTMAFTKDYGYVDLLPEKSKFIAPIQEKPKVVNTKKKEYARPPLPLKYFIPSLITGKNKEVYSAEKRYILINGKRVNDLKIFYGVSGADQIIHLNSANAIKKYGNAAKFGAVEITGKNIHLLSVNEGPPPPTVDVVRFPPPIVKPDPPTYKPKIQDQYGENFRFNRKTSKPERASKRYIVINGAPFEDQDKFYGVKNAESVTIISTEEATKRYGSKGAHGAVEITGPNITFYDSAPEPPPPVDVVKFPPPIVRKDKDRFTPWLGIKASTGKVVNLENRYIVINGTPLENVATFYGVTNTKDVIYLNKQAALKKYGQVAKYGAVEIIGDDIKYVTEVPVIPPPPVEPPPPRQDQVKFPPPIVKPDKPRKLLKTPPPPIEPRKNVSNSLKTREVLTGAKLVVTKVTPSKTSKDSVNFTAELRDVFKVIEYSNNTGKVILNWALCPDGKCPEMKEYKPGTLAYNQLSKLMTQVKPAKLAK